MPRTFAQQDAAHDEEALRLDGAAIDTHVFSERYDPRGLLGVGGMGEVRRCTDLKMGRDVALKQLLSRDDASRGMREARFVREARIQAQLEHPAIVPLYDLGALPDHTPYFTMKKLGGRTLADVLSAIAAGDTALKVDYGTHRLLSAFVTCCLAVAFAHERGVVHLDLKPDNIMLGDFGEVYVLDWGAAAVLGKEDSGSRGSTGTLGYMAPERAMGAATMPDPRSDVWSLGAILFEILTLEPLIRATSERSLRDGAFATEDALCRRRRPDLDIAPELEQVCVLATATLAERLPSARELAARITRFLEGDRDLALRRKLAASHVERARQAQLDARGAPRDDLDAEALRELSRALALDPENREASRVLMELWVAPPAASPEAERELAKLEAHSTQEASRVGGWGWVAWLALLPVLLLMGVLEPLTIALTLGLLGVAATLAFAMVRFPMRGRTLFWAMTLAGTVLIGATTRLFGPLIASPVLALSVVAALSVHPLMDRRLRWLMATLGCLSFTAPLALEALGWLDASYGFADGSLFVRANAVTLDPSWSLAFLVASPCTTIVAFSYLIGHFRDVLRRAERTVFLTAWRLRRLLPDEAELGARGEAAK